MSLYSRWYRFNTQTNVKYIKKFDIYETPNPLIEDGYTEWRRGTGPLPTNQYNKLVERMVKMSKGVPKPESTKHKMRLAKLGVPKTEEHKQNLRRGWLRRRHRELDAEKS